MPRIAELDGIKLFLQCWIVCGHFPGTKYNRGITARIINRGGTAVTFYIVLSGFVTTLAYRKKSLLTYMTCSSISTITNLFCLTFLRIPPSLVCQHFSSNGKFTDWSSFEIIVWYEFLSLHLSDIVARILTGEISYRVCSCLQVGIKILHNFKWIARCGLLVLYSSVGFYLSLHWFLYKMLKFPRLLF